MLRNNQYDASLEFLSMSFIHFMNRPFKVINWFSKFNFWLSVSMCSLIDKTFKLKNFVMIEFLKSLRTASTIIMIVIILHKNKLEILQQD